MKKVDNQTYTIQAIGTLLGLTLLGCFIALIKRESITGPYIYTVSLNAVEGIDSCPNKGKDILSDLGFVNNIEIRRKGEGQSFDSVRAYDLKKLASAYLYCGSFPNPSIVLSVSSYEPDDSYLRFRKAVRSYKNYLSTFDD